MGPRGDDEDSTDDDDARPRLKRDRYGFLQASDKHFEFDCPECDANNPWPDGFGDGETIGCHYCGLELRVTFGDRGKFRLKAL